MRKILHGFRGHGQLRTTHKYEVHYEVNNDPSVSKHSYLIGLITESDTSARHSVYSLSAHERIDFDTLRNMILGAIVEHEKKTITLAMEGIKYTAEIDTTRARKDLAQDLKAIGADGPVVIESFTNGVGSRIEAVHNLTKFVFAGNREFLVTHRLDNIGWTLVSIESLVDKKQYTLNELSKLIGKTFLLTQKALLVGCPNE